MIYLRMRYEILGGHTHIRVFAGENPKRPMVLSGNLIFDNDEWEDFKSLLAQQMPEHVQFFDDTKVE